MGAGRSSFGGPDLGPSRQPVGSAFADSSRARYPRNPSKTLLKGALPVSSVSDRRLPDRRVPGRQRGPQSSGAPIRVGASRFTALVFVFAVVVLQTSGLALAQDLKRSDSRPGVDSRPGDWQPESRRAGGISLQDIDRDIVVFPPRIPAGVPKSVLSPPGARDVGPEILAFPSEFSTSDSAASTLPWLAQFGQFEDQVWAELGARGALDTVPMVASPPLAVAVGDRLTSSVRELEARVKKDHPDLFAAARLRAVVALGGQWGQGLSWRALGIALSASGRSQVLGELEHTLGESLRAVGRFSDAEAALRRALQIRRTLLGADHSATHATVEALRDLYLAQGKYRAASDCEKLLPPKN